MTRWRPPEVWTGSQRGVLIGLLGCLLVYLIVRLLLNPLYVSDPQPARPPRYDDLADKIDPNTADWQTLAALPGLGEKRARTIVEYREAFVAKNPDHPAFSEPEDLMLVRGIGPSMLAALRPYMLFPPAPSSGSTATRPAN
ncbi:MAG: helix-hairpin-helix domain-containing protein [Planctomycetota bacterium]|nr:helix-hairpin-helix domain-containing protein [Planctomycetota bacterium]